MSKKQCTFVKKRKKACQNDVIEGFNFCKSHMYKLDSTIRCSIPDHVVHEASRDGMGFVFDANLGHVYYLNATASYLFLMIKKNKPLSEIILTASNHYGVEPAKILSDFRDFYDNLTDLGLIIQNEES